MRIALIQGHPDPAGGHFCHALADAYERSARESGHEVRVVDVAGLDLPLLRNSADWQEGPAPAEVQQALAWAEHWVIVFPLWLGDMPARFKGFFEQVMRPGFAIGEAAAGRLPKKLLKGRSARIIVTMGMPALFYKLYYRAHSIKSLKRNVLEFCGVSPVRASVIGMVEGSAASRESWLQKVALLGRQAK